MLGISFLVGLEACSVPVGWRPLAVEEEILNAEQVMFGEVWRTFPHSDAPWQENLYTAEVRVYCILKGRRSTQIVNITEVGQFFYT